MNTVSVYGLLIVAAWCSFPSPAAAQCAAANQNCTYGSDTCCNGTYCYPPERVIIDDYGGELEAEGRQSVCKTCLSEDEPCLGAVGRGECCSDPKVEIKCKFYRSLDDLEDRCLVVCRGVGGECREGRGAVDCCQPNFERVTNECRKSNSSGRFTCTETLGVYERCGRDAEFNSSTPCASGLSCVERNVVVTPQEFAQQNNSGLGVLGGALSDLFLKKFVCDPIDTPSCIALRGPCTANYRGKGNCCNRPIRINFNNIPYCRNDTAVSARSPVYNGVCALCSQHIGACTSDEQCCPLAGGYCDAGMTIFKNNRRCQQCSARGDGCNERIKCCSPNDTCRVGGAYGPELSTCQ